MTPATLTLHLQTSLDALCPEGVPRALGLAVSGGGDSMALLRAGADWAQRRRAAVFVATVDHGLRPEAASEAAFVAAACRDLDLPHVILHPETPLADEGGNLQAAARQARLVLLAGWAHDLELRHVAMAHTLDDQAETVLMRLARGSGVDGLAGMAPRRDGDGIAWLRPFLGVRRAALRTALETWGQDWVEDPSNSDTRFDRVKARAALVQLAPLGLDAPRLARTAEIMRDARAALHAATHDLAEAAVQIQAGDVLLDAALLDAAPFDLRARLLAHAMGWVASSPYRPRFRSLSAVMDRLAEGRTQTLQGCLLSRDGACIRVAREPAAVAETIGAAPGLWDGRWHLDGPAQPDVQIRALGDAGALALPENLRGPLPRASRAGMPAIWQGGAVIAAPLPDFADNGWTVTLRRDAREFMMSIIAD